MQLSLYQNSLRLILFFVSFGMMMSCIEAYDKAYNLKASPLIVDGFITDQVEADTILIRVSRATTSSSYIEPLTGCKVFVSENGGTPVALREFGSGKYATPVGFRGKIGNTYQLQFTTPDGRRYESSSDKMVGVSDLQKVYDVFDTKAYTNDKGTVFYPANVIYIDTQDPANERNFYLWRYIQWEREDICATCDRGTYDKPTESCIPGRGFNPPTYDYECEGSCWAIIYGTSVNVFSDVNANGKVINGRIVAKIPYYNFTGCLVEIQQASISADCYAFYRLLDQQGQSTGSLTDTPPAALVGNIRNVNVASEPVVGYFGASSIKKVRYWLDRKNAKGQRSSLLGREPNLEPPKGLPPSVTLAKCFASRTRTPFKPNGWLN